MENDDQYENDDQIEHHCSIYFYVYDSKSKCFKQNSDSVVGCALISNAHTKFKILFYDSEKKSLLELDLNTKWTDFHVQKDLYLHFHHKKHYSMRFRNEEELELFLIATVCVRAQITIMNEAIGKKDIAFSLSLTAESDGNAIAAQENDTVAIESYFWESQLNTPPFTLNKDPTQYFRNQSKRQDLCKIHKITIDPTTTDPIMANLSKETMTMKKNDVRLITIIFPNLQKWTITRVKLLKIKHHAQTQRLVADSPNSHLIERMASLSHAASNMHSHLPIPPLPLATSSHHASPSHRQPSITAPYHQKSTMERELKNLSQEQEAIDQMKKDLQEQKKQFASMESSVNISRSEALSLPLPPFQFSPLQIPSLPTAFTPFTKNERSSTNLETEVMRLQRSSFSIEESLQALHTKVDRALFGSDVMHLASTGYGIRMQNTEQEQLTQHCKRLEKEKQRLETLLYECATQRHNFRPETSLLGYKSYMSDQDTSRVELSRAQEELQTLRHELSARREEEGALLRLTTEIAQLKCSLETANIESDRLRSERQTLEEKYFQYKTQTQSQLEAREKEAQTNRTYAESLEQKQTEIQRRQQEAMEEALKSGMNALYFVFQDAFEEENEFMGKEIVIAARKILKQSTLDMISKIKAIYSA